MRGDRFVAVGATVGKSPARVAESPRRIIVDDNNVDAAESLAMLLRLAGHVVQTAHNGPDATGLAETAAPEVIFLDIGLPGMKGYEVASRLRASPEHSAVALVAVSGWGTDGDRRRDKEAGFDHHLTKPADARDVNELIARLSDRGF